MFKRIGELERVEIPAAKAEVEAIRKNKSFRTDEAREQMAANAEAKLNALKDESRGLKLRLQKAGKKSAKIDRDTAKIAANEKKIEQLQGLKAGKSAEEVAVLDDEIRGYNADNDSLRAKIKRKGKAYAKKTGETIEESRGSNVVQPVVLPKIQTTTLTDEEKRGIDGCWTPSDKPIGKTAVAFYSLGKDEVPDGAHLGEPEKLEALFEKSADDVRQALYDARSGSTAKIARIEATSSVSRVRGSKSAEALAAQRSRKANNRFNAFLKNPKEGLAVDELNSFESKVGKGRTTVQGPEWKPADYANLSKKKVTNEMLKKAATDIVDGKIGSMVKGKFVPDYTPARVDVGTREEQINGTIEKLKDCCGTNAATLKYQPYQFTQIEVYGATYTPFAETCVRSTAQVGTQVGTKSVGEQSVTNCPPLGERGHHECLEALSGPASEGVKKSGAIK
jgi:hypothetical protein